MSTNLATEIFSAARPRAARQRERDTEIPRLDEGRLTHFLGWFSIGLGLAEVVAPRAIARLVGTDNHRALIRCYGLREITSGVGILTQPRPAAWVWSRVGGDVLDLASLGAALGSRKNERGKTVGAITAVAGVTALDVLCAQRLSAQDGAPSSGRAVRVESSLIVNRPPEDCYRFWRDFENLPRFMSHVLSVRITGDRRSHWIVKAPGGGACIEWDAELVEDIPNQRISWRTLPGAPASHTGSVQFEAAPGGRGTLIRMQFEYGHPGQAVVSAFARLVGKHPEQMANKDLRRFKQVLETGEAITTEGQPAGRRRSTTLLDRIAR